MKTLHLSLILLLLLFSQTLSQKTDSDRNQEAAERETISREKDWRFEMDDGQHLSLYHLRKKRAPDYTFQDSTETGLYKYFFNFWAPTVMTWNGEEDALAIQKIDDDCIGVLARGSYSSISYLDEDRPKAGVRLVFDGGDAWSTGNRRVEHILKWDENIHHEIESVEERDTCTYTVTSRTKYACKLAETRQDLASWEDEWYSPDSVTETRGWSLWDSGLMRLTFLLVLVFLAVSSFNILLNIVEHLAFLQKPGKRPIKKLFECSANEGESGELLRNDSWKTKWSISNLLKCLKLYSIKTDN